ELVRDIDLLAAGAVGNEGDPFPVRRPARALLFPRRLGDSLDLAAIGGDGEDLAVHRNRGAPVRRRQAEAFHFVVDRYQLGLFVLEIALHVDTDFGALAAGRIELPDAEVVLVDDGLAVRRDAGEVEIAVAVMRHLGGLAALV